MTYLSSYLVSCLIMSWAVLRLSWKRQVTFPQYLWPTHTHTIHTCRYRAQRIVSLFNMNIVVSGSCESVILSVVTSRPATWWMVSSPHSRDTNTWRQDLGQVPGHTNINFTTVFRVTPPPPPPRYTDLIRISLEVIDPENKGWGPELTDYWSENRHTWIS